MIVFNLLAIVVGLIIGVFLGPMYWLFPAFMGTTWGNVAAFSTVTVVSLAADFLGLKGRLFWLPMWLWGLVGVGVNLHTILGWLGIGVALGAVVLLFVLLGVLAAVNDRKAWAQAPGSLNAARDAFARGHADEAWPHLEKAFFAPTWMTETQETSRHNLEVRSVARASRAATVGSLELRLFEALGLAYRDAMTTGKPEIPSALTSAMQSLLGNKGSLNAGDHPALAAALDKPATATS